MSIVKVLFFGAAADAVGAREMVVPIGSQASSDTVLERLVLDHPQLEDHKLLFAINEEYADRGTRLKDGDEVAIFTAVSGG